MPYTADIDFDPLPVIRAVRAPMLALLGADDPLVPARETAALLSGLNKPNLTVHVIAGANHNMSPANRNQPVAEYWQAMFQWLQSLW
jgi:fermentation-respiration switch protein FrsA (DUF1100 family)